LAAPEVKARLGEPVLAAQLIHRHAGLRLPEEPDDLLFGKPLLHSSNLRLRGQTLDRTATQRRGNVARSVSAYDQVLETHVYQSGIIWSRRLLCIRGGRSDYRSHQPIEFALKPAI